MVQELTNEKELQDAVAAGPVVADFYATWCGPCKLIAPKFEAWEKEYPKIKFIKVDAEAHSDISVNFHVTAMPTFVFFDGDYTKPAVLVGANTAKVEEKLKEIHAKAEATPA
eukprot:Trichotokara_eunicae@DN5596_c0_g1_i1.p2